MPTEPSVGVKYLVVAGTLVVEDGKIVPNVFPGACNRWSVCEPFDHAR